MSAGDYNEEKALARYVWDHYPEIVPMDECIPPPELIRDHLPEELRDEFMAHMMECRTIGEEHAAANRKYLEEMGNVRETLMNFPPMRPEFVGLVVPLINELTAKLVRDIYEANREKIVVRRCAGCNRILASPRSHQCLWCGSQWQE